MVGYEIRCISIRWLPLALLRRPCYTPFALGTLIVRFVKIVWIMRVVGVSKILAVATRFAMVVLMTSTYEYSSFYKQLSRLLMGTPVFLYSVIGFARSCQFSTAFSEEPFLCERFGNVHRYFMVLVPLM